jgi:pyridoxal phosphate enzyme (YggS family)
MDKITPLIEHGHKDFGENKVQEALNKWSDVKSQNNNIKLHLIGGLQTNKVKFAIGLFDYIHSVDSEKLARKIFDEQKKQNKKVKIFLQVNIGNELQKFGVDKSYVGDLYSFCKGLELDVVGLMCIPPEGEQSAKYFKEMNDLNKNLNLDYLSMGMSSDYLEAAKNNATHLRIGSNIFGSRI